MQDNQKIDDGNPIISREYGINTEMYMKAFKVFQQKYVYPRNYIMTLLFLAIGGYYLWLIMQDTENMSYMLFIALSIMLISSMWLGTFNQRIKLRKAVDNINDDRYKLEIFNEGLTIEMFQQSDDKNVENNSENESFQQSDNENVENSSENKNFQQSDSANVENGIIDEEFFAPPPAENQNQKTYIRFDKNVVVIDKDEFFLVYIKKSVFYIIPKKDFSEEETLVIEQHFRNRLQKSAVPTSNS